MYKEMRSPEKFMEAKYTVDNSAEHLAAESRSSDGDFKMKGREKLQNRRLGLGAKRAQSTFRSRFSQPIAAIGDPVEYCREGAKLEDAGTSFEKGVRRSSRTKTKPLEFWRGKHGRDQLIPVDVGSSELRPQHHSKAKTNSEEAKRPAGVQRESAVTPLENGVRRSRRRKTCPLEFWRGEYGHDNENPLIPVEVSSSELRPHRRSKVETKTEKAKRSAGGQHENAGTSFEDEVRRSRRTKIRPLSFWKGEKPLYRDFNGGRMLVGVRYLTPQGSFKAKSCISDDYRDVVKLAAICG